VAAVAQIFEKFEENPGLWTRAIRDRIKSDAGGFCEEAVGVLRRAVDNSGLRPHLGGGKALTLILCDPELLSEEQASRLVDRLKRIGLVFERGIFEEVFGADGTGGMSATDPAYGLRFLQIFGQSTNSARLLSVLSGLLRHPNAKIRSKVTAIAGKVTHRFDWVEQLSAEDDERVRANALEALWKPGLPEQCRSTLWASVCDGNNRVAGNALLGLYRHGDSRCIAPISALTAHVEEKFRATAAWVIAQTGDERFRERLLPLLDDQDTLVRQNAVQALKRLDESERTATEEIRLIPFSVREANPLKQTIHVAAVSMQGTLLPLLAPTDFRLWRNSTFIESYTVTSRPAREGISVTFAFPGIDNRRNDLRQKWGAILTRCFPQKRRLDYWGLLEYGDAPEREEPKTGNRTANTSASKMRPVFVRNSLELEDFVKPMMKSKARPDFSEALELLLTPPPFVRGGLPTRKESAHAVMIDLTGSHEFSREQVQAIKAIALKNDFTVHGVSVDGSSFLAELAEATGGAFLVSRGNMESAGRELLAIYNALRSMYGIEFEATPGDDAERTQIKLGVRRGSSFGETQIDPAKAGEPCAESCGSAEEVPR
jgi:HEAT repeat protein